MVATKIARFAWMAIAGSLAACSGGSGGGSAPAGGGPSVEPTLTLTNNTLAFSSRAPGVDPAEQYITASVSGADQLRGTLYVLVTVEGAAVRNVGNININPQTATGSATVYPQLSRTLGSGSYTSTIRVTACVDSPTCSSGQLRGSPQVVNVSYSIDTFQPRHELVASATGLAFTSLPTLSNLTRTLQVTDSQGHTIAWSATSDQTWLDVTSGGLTGGDLVVTADPTGLASDTIHYANVSITAAESGVARNETVRVGLWVGATDPAPTTIIASRFERVLADPIRPLIYAHDGGTTLFVYNVFTGARVAEIPVDRSLGAMEIEPDGSRLFAGTSNTISSASILPIDLSNHSVGNPWRAIRIGPTSLGELEYLRVDGAGLLLSGGGGFVFNTRTGMLFTTYGSPHFSDAVAASADGKRVCSVPRETLPYTMTCYSVQYSDIGGDLAVFQPAVQTTIAKSVTDIALNRDGSRVYIAARDQYFDVQTFASATFDHLVGDYYTNNVEIARDGRLFGGASSASGPTDVWEFNADETLRRQTRIAGPAKALLDGTLKLSSDGLRMIVLTDDPKMQITTVAP